MDNDDGLFVHISSFSVMLPHYVSSLFVTLQEHNLAYARELDRLHTELLKELSSSMEGSSSVPTKQLCINLRCNRKKTSFVWANGSPEKNSNGSPENKSLY